MKKIKQYRILHVISGNYCILAPLNEDRNYYVLDFEINNEGWAAIRKSIDKKLWDWFWTVPGSLELASHLCNKSCNIYNIMEHMTKDEFELEEIKNGTKDI